MTMTSIVDSDTVMLDYSFFRTQLDTIPPPAFFDQDTREYLLGDVEDSEDEETDLSSTSAWKDKAKRPRNKADSAANGGRPTKKIKLHPLNTKTVSQIQSDLLKQESEQEESFNKVKFKIKQKKGKKAAKHVDNTEKRREMIREMLQHKIDQLQAKRGKLTREDLREKKKLKRRQSKLKSKMKKRTEKQNRGSRPETPGPAIVNVNGVVIGSKQKIKPIYSKEGKLVFSKFDFSESGEKEKSQSDLVGKDYKRLLEKVEKRHQHIEKLKEKDASLAKQVKDKSAWQAALHKAEGEKVKDDPILLKKALKRKEKMKEKRKKKWSDRKHQEQKRIDAKQEKRQKNIQQRKKAKIDKKIKKAKKKGRIIPGF